MAHGTHDFAEDARNDHILVWVNGELVPRERAVVSVFDAGFVLGDGVWEGLRVRAGHPAFVERHLDRLFEGATAIVLDIGQTREQLTAAIYQTLAANEMADGVHVRLMRCAIEAGSGWAVGRLVSWLESIGCEDEMEPIVRKAAENGHAQSIASLVWRLEDAGRSEEANAWTMRLQHAAESGDREAMLWWTARLKSSKSPELEEWLVRSAEAGIPEAIVTMSDRQMWYSDNPKVERVMQQAADGGNATAMDFLHKLLIRKGRTHDVDRMWVRAAETGNAYAMHTVAIRLADTDDLQYP